MRAPEQYTRLVRLVEWKLIKMPLPRLQTMGQSQQPFIYEIHWDHSVEQREVTVYQRGEASGFDKLAGGVDAPRARKTRETHRRKRRREQ